MIRQVTSCDICGKDFDHYKHKIRLEIDKGDFWSFQDLCIECHNKLLQYYYKEKKENDR